MNNTKCINKRDLIKTILNIYRIIWLSIIYIFFIFIFYDNDFEFDYGIRGYIVLCVAYLLILFSTFDIFDVHKYENRFNLDLLISIVFSILLVNTFAYFILSLIEGHLVNVKYHLLIVAVQMLIITISSYFENKFVKKIVLPEKTALIYGDECYKNLIQKINKYQADKFQITKAISEKKCTKRKIIELISENDSLMTFEVKHSQKKKIAKICYENNVNLYDVPSILDILVKSSRIINYFDTPLIRLNKFGPNKLESIIKRFFDILCSLLILIVFFPILLIVSMIIKFQDGGDIFFKQERLTQNGKHFYLIKFRSMIMNAEPNGVAIRTKINDERITPFGKFMRSTRIDELPQVINILKGDLSFIGPRALRIEEYKENERNFPEFKYRLKVKAGLSGYAQIYGKYNTSFRDKLLLDMIYIENFSLIMDAKLIFMTLVTIFKKDSTEGF